jgi:hypothetical protein
VRGPRKSKCMTICDRMAEKVASVHEWTICNDGRADSEEERGQYIITNRKLPLAVSNI